MPNFIKGNLWDSPDDWKIVTGNSTIKKDGSLVMGRGAALAAKIRFPKIPYIFGNMITSAGEDYGLLLCHEYSLGLFQVKHHYSADAELKLIDYSTFLLKELALASLDVTYSMNFPGIGYGHRKRELVLPILMQLPSNITIYEHAFE